MMPTTMTAERVEYPAMPTISDVSVCPRCQNTIQDASTSWSCTSCEASFPVVDGFVDFCPESRHQAGLGQLGMEIPPLVSIYEKALRPRELRRHQLLELPAADPEHAQGPQRDRPHLDAGRHVYLLHLPEVACRRLSRLSGHA